MFILDICEWVIGVMIPLLIQQIATQSIPILVKDE